MAIDDHYATLGVSPDSDANAIQSAYRALMRRYHPDVNASHGAASRAKAINEAYACLRDPAKRASYDRSRPIAARHPVSTNGPVPSSYHRPAWTGSHAAVQDVRNLRPTWRQAAGLGVAAMITAITFAATSATGPFAMRHASPVIDVQLRAANIPVPPPAIGSEDAPDRSIGDTTGNSAAPPLSRQE